MERKLASIQRVLEITPIENADAIELVRINGWQCVTKKGEFRVGDCGVFFEIDAVPPDRELFRFLWTPRDTTEPVARPEKFRIRTMRLRGALSQGLFMPLSAFDLGPVAEGEDVTARLGVGKYEPPAPTGMGDFRAHFPAFIPKTDLYWQMARKYNIEETLRAAPHRAIQGEIVGPGVQRNRLGLKEVSLFAFSVYDITAARFLDHDDARAFLADAGIPAVEIVEEGDSFAHTQESLLALAEGKYPGTTNEREGIVIRPRRETFSAVLGGRLSFKAISNRFLLKETD
jgi:hypothetical protein